MQVERQTMKNNLNYGIIGNCRSAALISETGAIDWCCLPRFDSASAFGRLLDQDIGGTFEVRVDAQYRIFQEYEKNTNILKTRFDSGSDCFELLDFMPRFKEHASKYHNPPDIIRYFRNVSGTPRFTLHYAPALKYAAVPTRTFIDRDFIKSVTESGEYDSLYLYSSFDYEKILNEDEIELAKDGFVLLSYNQKLLHQTVELQHLKLAKTTAYWLNWAYELPRYARYQEHIVRSALTLKLLSYDKTGAILAAATTSLPETIGEVRNWDYRFCWIRDASMVVKIMTQLGHLEMVERFVRFVIDIIPEKNEKIQIMYGIDRQKELTEYTLDHLQGYASSSPVRVGNAAYMQKQNDIYGVLMDVIWQHFQLFENALDNSEDLWTITRSIVKIVAANWRKPDKGIWEIRTEDRHFTFSKVLCWVAVDRAIQVAETIRRKAYLEAWRRLADDIRNDIFENAWNEERQSFTQHYGSDDQDAANLLMEPYGFIDASDDKYRKTVIAVEEALCRDGLMYRYKNQDDFGLPSSSFTICTFWLIKALTAIGERKRAEEMFEKLLSYSNHLGLFSEDIDFDTKRLLGNFPQAYSHLALIETAIHLSHGQLTEDEKVREILHR